MKKSKVLTQRLAKRRLAHSNEFSLEETEKLKKKESAGWEVIEEVEEVELGQNGENFTRNPLTEIENPPQRNNVNDWNTDYPTSQNSGIELYRTRTNEFDFENNGENFNPNPNYGIQGQNFNKKIKKKQAKRFESNQTNSGNFGSQDPFSGGAW